MIPKTPVLSRTWLMAMAVIACSLTVAAEDAKLDGDVVSTDRARISIGTNALPLQFTIPATPAELPLSARGDGQATPAVLAEIGRGEQLRAPMRFVARIAGNTVEAEAGAAQKVQAGGEVNATAKAKAGDLPVDLKIQYGGGGIMTLAVTYGGGGIEVDSLALVLDLVGLVDTAIYGGVPKADGAFGRIAPDAYKVGRDEGVAWSEQDGRPGIADTVYIGSGDRGFTFSAGEAGFLGDSAQPALTVERDAEGAGSIYLYLVNKTTKLDQPATASITIYPHPAKIPAPGARLAAWQPWDAKAPGIVTADRLASPGPTAAGVLLAGPYGGAQALDPRTPISSVYPIALWRYLSAHQTGLPAQLRPSQPDSYQGGDDPGLDRMALGRALLHDIGIDASTLVHSTDAAVLAKALYAFGYFTADGQTEFVPYWRSASLVRFGEVFTAGDSFEVTQDDPMAHVHTSVFLRPGAKAGQYKALILVVNESDGPVRENLYITDPARVFGPKGNTLLGREIQERWETAGIPEASDWRVAKLKGDTNSDKEPGSNAKSYPLPYLQDLEDNGYVRQNTKTDALEIYGLLHIHARSYRVLYGEGDLE